MTIVGCDFHPSWQQIAVFDTETGEVRECKLVNGNGEAERFYRRLSSPALVGVEACGNSQWFVDMLQRLGHEVWIGDAAQIRASYVRKQKTDRRDAAHILKLLIEGRFPRLWTPSAEQRNLRQLLIHRHKLVGIRVQVKNGLQHLMLNRGVQLKEKLWSQAGQKALRELTLAGWAAQRRKDLLSLLASLNEQIGQLDQATEKAAAENQEARLLMTHPGVGPITALAFVLTLGEVTRFKRGKQVSSYLGLVPREHSSSGKQRLGSISKQGTASCACCWWRAHKRSRVWTKGFASNTSAVVTTWRKELPKWRQRAGYPYDSSGCCARTQLIRRSFASRVARAKPWSAEARPRN
jgi:transposase